MKKESLHHWPDAWASAGGETVISPMEIGSKNETFLDNLESPV